MGGRFAAERQQFSAVKTDGVTSISAVGRDWIFGKACSHMIDVFGQCRAEFGGEGTEFGMALRSDECVAQFNNAIFRASGHSAKDATGFLSGTIQFLH